MELQDFSKAKYTAIVSDLHLSEAEPIHPRFPLWKKFKTREFFFDDVFVQFLDYLQQKSSGEKIELILNGDIFDFDSVMSLPKDPTFRVSWLEKKRGLFPRPERSQFKIQVILKDHEVFMNGLKKFIQNGHRVVFVIGNHDVELHFPQVQKQITLFLGLDEAQKKQIRFCEWFYISNQDTLIEHGNQYDPYCVCEQPTHPFVQGYNFKSMKLPFGNVACRMILNGMGFFNPHVDSNYIMSLPEYIRFFFKYIARAQPFLVWTWFWGALVTLFYAFQESLEVPIKNPLGVEDRIDEISKKSNSSSRVVRELQELAAIPANTSPYLLAKELWLDRALIVFIAFIVILEIMLILNSISNLSFYWAFIPLFAMLPFYLFYSKSVTSLVSSYKQPDDRILALSSLITQTDRIVYGHTHHIRHEMIGAVEHLNSGCWSPAFLDVECTKSIDQKTFVWIEPYEDKRKASLRIFKDQKSKEILNKSISV